MATEAFYDTQEHPFLDEDTFQNEHSQRLFEAIDELRSCGANHDIDLPELVIVGDQSAGKSSLLQSLTDIPFPVADRLCTRFPTRIVSRRTPNEVENIKISIEPQLFGGYFPTTHNGDAIASTDRRNIIAKFPRTVSSLTAKEFKTIVEDASKIMEISPSSLQEPENGTTPSNRAIRNFSNDILKVEISGPTRSYFSILDVPGIFQSLTKGLKEDEKIGVHRMVTSFMAPKQSIIICVASGTNDLANQAAFDIASRQDPKGERTVGVITKCDVTQHIDHVMDLARNQEKRLQHGWFVVRNRTPSEAMEGIDAAGRYKREREFFNEMPWKSLPENRKGSQALKKYLANLLCMRIQQTFPKMREVIRDRQRSNKAHLKSLGTYRETPEQRRTYLTTIAQRFHSLASDALRGRYDSIETDKMKLRMMVRGANDEFASDMRLHGQRFSFLQIPTSGGSNPSLGSSSELVLKPTNSATPNLTAKGTGVEFGGFENKSANQEWSPPNVGFQTPIPATKYINFQEHTSRYVAPIAQEFFQSISCMPIYEKYSFEELRLNDHLQNQQKPPSSGSPLTFGSQSQTTAGAAALVKNSFSGSSNLFTEHTALPNPYAIYLPSLEPADRRSSLIYGWIRNEVAACRGTELQGTLNPDVLPVLFHKQASKWRAMAEAHFAKVKITTLTTVIKMLESVCPDLNTRAQIKSLIEEASVRGQTRGLDLLSERLEEVLSGHLQTNNPAFEAEVRNARLLRFQGAVERYRSSRIAFNSTATNQNSQSEANHNTMFTIDMRDTASLFAELHISNAQNFEDEIHDTLKAYYEIARNDFIEFVNHIIVERYLNDLQGPVLLFSPLYVGGLSEEELRKLTAENESVVLEREKVKATLERLNRAEEISLKYA